MRLTGVLVLLLAILHMSSASTGSRENNLGLQQVSNPRRKFFLHPYSEFF
jgi:hypothetical protein